MIWNFCIRRPVLTVVVFVVIAVFGVRGYLQLPVRQRPDVEFPVTTVNVVLPGAEPGVIETEIIDPLESELNTIEGLKQLTSTSREEVASITAEFELWRDIDVATQDVRDRVDRAQRQLPDGIEAPIVRKLDPDARAIMWITLTGDERWDPVRLTEFADKELKERLESIRGVGRIQIGGERLYAIRIRLDPERLAAHHLTVQDVVGAIQEQNVDIPSGRLEGRRRELLVKTQGQFASPEPFNDMVVAHRDGTPVRLEDVGRAVEGVENQRTVARFAGEVTSGLGIVKQSDANAVALADRVKEEIRGLAEEFPPGLRYTIASDETRYTRENISDLQTTVLLATGLVVLVVMLFLGSVSGTLVTALAIPTSLLAGTALMGAMGFSLNVLTMLALILVVGIVVDDAIVILESTYRHVEHGAEPVPAARTGTTEVAFAAIANSLSLAAVFVPVAFTQGLIGRFFFEFGITVTLTVFASTFTALTLTPMLASRFLRARRGGEGSGPAPRRGPMALLEAVYGGLLNAAFRHRFVTVLLAIAVAYGGYWFFQRLSKEFEPSVDREEFMISFETPEGATLSETDAYAREIERVLDEEPTVTHQFLAIGLSQAGPGQVNEGMAFVHMTKRQKRQRHQTEVMQDVREELRRVPGGQAYVISPGGPGGQGSPIQLVLRSPDVDQLARLQERLMGWMRQQGDYVGVHSDLELNKPQVRVRLDRDKAATLGVSVADVSNTLRLLLGEPTISEIEREGERYDVIPEIAGSDEGMIPSDMQDIYVRGDEGQLVALGNLVRTEEAIGPSALHHFNRRRAVTISASTPPEVAMGDALERLQRHVAETLPPGVDQTVTGQAQDFEESFYYLGLALAFAIAFIFLVLAAQFESFIHPLTILLALPLATIGAFGALWAFDMTFNIFSFIGLIMLLGMVTKNAILLVDYANVLVARGRGRREAAKEAARVRLRPVLMTAVSTLGGMLPIALGFGAGGESRAPLGVIVAAGMVASTLLTLVVIPVVHTLFGDAVAALASLFRRGGGSRSEEASP